MIDPKLLREQFEVVKKGIEIRNQSMAALNLYAECDQKWRQALRELELKKSEQNRLTPKGKPTPEQMAQLKSLSDEIKQMQGTVLGLEEQARQAALMLPNIPAADVPVGKSEEDNFEVRRIGEVKKFDFEPKPHHELGEALGILDFKRAALITGARFAIYRKWGAKLERALIQLMLDTHTNAHGYEEILPPVMVNSASMQGTGQLPKFADESFQIKDTDYWLSPTAEVQLTNMFRDSILAEEQLPMCVTAYTACFRKEAGSYGKDIAGIIRQHQFNKVELVQLVRPEDSFEALERLLGHAEMILKKLELPYRVVKLCTADLGFSSAKTYDIEVWFPSQNRYREISSCSNFLDFQSRRAMIRYKQKVDGRVNYLHTLNGSGLAVGRTWAAILENYQQKDGSVTVPKVLQPYLGVEKIA